jgi:UDP-N-acetylglucosamine:LPS N-acetylglucosamine transferase
VAATQARELGAAQVVTVDPAVDPRFFPSTEASRAWARAKFGLPADGKLALLVGGSWGIGEFEETVRDITATGTARCVVVCGQNDDLRKRLLEQGVEHVYGWVDDMPGLMHACDVLVQNAGGMTVYEARASRLPVVTYRTLPGHGETNAQSLDEAGTAPWVRDAADLRVTLEKALQERPWDVVPEFAADPVAVILGMAPQHGNDAVGRIPKQRDRKNRRWERRLRGVRFGTSARDGGEHGEHGEFGYERREVA